MKHAVPPLLLIAAAVGGVIAGWKLKPAPEAPTFRPKTIYVVDTVELYRDKPDATPSLPHRVFWKPTTPTQKVLTTTTPERPRVVAYCAPVATPDTARPLPDSAKKRGSGPAILPPVSLKYDGKRLRFWSVLGDGRAFYQENKVGTPFEALTNDSSWTVRERRFKVDLGGYAEANYLTGEMPFELRGGGTLELGPLTTHAGAAMRFGPNRPEGELFAGIRKEFRIW